MSRPKIPNVSWRQCRIAAALLMAGLLATAALTPQADAQDHSPTREHKPAVLTPTMTPLGDILHASRFDLATALNLQSAAQTKAHQQAVAEAAAKRRATQAKEAAQHRAEERAAAQRRAALREHSAPQPASRTQRRTVPAQAATVTGAQSMARSQLSSTQYQCLSSLVSRESGWNHRAQNPSSGAYGLFQALPGSKMASAGSDWQSNPLTQMRWGLSYIKSRYGTPCGAWNFWQKNRWY
ncbi:aggregation-promoting factor C-terminal-like domain-containing protein [Streptomyces drozdowiczii]